MNEYRVLHYLKFSVSITLAFLCVVSLASQEASIQNGRHGDVRYTQVESDSLNRDCGVLWEDVVLGICIGENNGLIPYDFDSDGTLELITSGNFYGYFGEEHGFWYVLEHDGTTMTYNDIAVGEMYSNDISKLALVDLFDDGQMELLVAAENTLDIVSLQTCSSIQSVVFDNIPAFYGIRQMRYADADNDGIKEIVVSGFDDLLLLDAITLEIEAHLEFDAGDFAIGNVDSDDLLETVFTNGSTIEISPDGAYILQTDFRPDQDNPTNSIELSDIDSDGYLEAIIADHVSYLKVFDVDISTLKYEIDTFFGIDEFALNDLDGDGIDEIVFGENGWGEIHAHDGATGSWLWSLENPVHGVTGIAIADFDNDLTKEIIWGAGCSSTGPDHLYAYDLVNFVEEWSSIDINGPYYAVDVADADEDGDFEIITITHKSDGGSSGGVLTVYDAVTKEVEFQEDADFFNSFWNGTYNLEVVDYADDGDLDIVVAAGRQYEGKYWVIDGNSYFLEEEYIFPLQDEVSKFYASTTVDIDGDDTLDFVSASQEKLYIVNSLTFAIDYETSISFAPGTTRDLAVGNLDADLQKEIVICKGYILRFDDTDYSMTQSLQNNYTTIELYDWNGDGMLDIIAGTSEGSIDVLQGLTLDIIETYQLGIGMIGGIEVHGINGNGLFGIIATLGNTVCFVDPDGSFIQTQELAPVLGEFDGLSVVDYDQNGLPNIIVGSGFSVMEVDNSCAECQWFEPTFEVLNSNCGDGNGIILTTTSATVTDFYLDNIPQSSTEYIDQLHAGSYSISATYNNTCFVDTIVTIYDDLTDCPITIELPNVFTPNGDGVNDNFKPVRIEGIISMTTIIYNRWGASVYESSGDVIDWNGSEFSEGTYYYSISYIDITNNSNLVKGYVTLIR